MLEKSPQKNSRVQNQGLKINGPSLNAKKRVKGAKGEIVQIQGPVWMRFADHIPPLLGALGETGGPR